ncbi:MAG TPA: hypothetical protein VGK00_01880 [Anaerolineales bacterium]|jgi:4-amino-4-deoxy-L-arabinose transferase-like glycosyltransferase
MTIGSGISVKKSPGRRFLGLPTTYLGKWAAILFGIFVVMFLVNSFVFMPFNGTFPLQEVFLPFYGIAMLACGLASGVCGLIAMIKKGERSWLVWLTLLPGFFVIFMLVGEFLIPPFH